MQLNIYASNMYTGRTTFECAGMFSKSWYSSNYGTNVTGGYPTGTRLWLATC